MRRPAIRRAVIATSFALAGMGFSVFATAQASPFYVGGSIGQSRVKIDSGSLQSDLAAAGIGTTGFANNETDTGWKLYAGYRFHPNFAVEGGFVDLGKFSTNTNVTSVLGVPVTPTGLNVDIKTSNGFDIAGVGMWPVTNQFSLFGKIGMYHIKTELTASIGGVSDSESASNNGWLAGLGVGYEVTKTFGLRAEWERFNNVGDKDKTGQGDIDLFTLGVVYHF